MLRDIILANDRLTARISPLGAELKALTSKASGRSVVWEGSPAVWNDSAPWLFPIVGQLKDDRFRWKGQWYTLPQHGFAKSNLFEVRESCENKVMLALHDTPETRSSYPWPFLLTVAYCLTADSLTVTVQVANTGTEDMYFSLGAHPGFYAAPGDALQFEIPEDAAVYRLEAATHLRQLQAEERLRGDLLTLWPTLFQKDALLLQAPRSRSVTLLRGGKPVVRLSYPAVPYLGIWSRPSQPLPYVCVEPWFGVDDPVNAGGQIESKDAIQILPPNEHFTMTLSIQILEAQA